MGPLILLGCGPAPPPPRNLLIVAHDSTRYDHTSLSGYARDTTPVLAELAAEPGATSCTLAWSPASFSLPSCASLFTGRPAHEHQVGFGDNEGPAAATTLAEALSAHGWQAGAHLSAQTARGQGFDVPVSLTGLVASVSGWFGSRRRRRRPSPASRRGRPPPHPASRPRAAATRCAARIASLWASTSARSGRLVRLRRRGRPRGAAGGGRLLVRRAGEAVGQRHPG